MSKKQVTFSLPQAVISLENLQALRAREQVFNYFTQKAILMANWKKKPLLELNQHTHIILDSSHLAKLSEDQPNLAETYAVYKYLFKYYVLPKRRIIPLRDEGLFDYIWDEHYHQYFPAHRLVEELDGLNIERRLRIVWYLPGKRYVPVLHRAFQLHLQVVYDAASNEYQASELDAKQCDDYLRQGFLMKINAPDHPVIPKPVSDRLLQVWDRDFKDTPAYDRIEDSLTPREEDILTQVAGKLSRLPDIEYSQAPEKQSLPESDSEAEPLSTRTPSGAESSDDVSEDPIEQLPGAIGGLSLAEEKIEPKGFKPLS